MIDVPPTSNFKKWRLKRKAIKNDYLILKDHFYKDNTIFKKYKINKSHILTNFVLASIIFISILYLY